MEVRVSQGMGSGDFKTKDEMRGFLHCGGEVRHRRSK
jgi:hypothetical protein